MLRAPHSCELLPAHLRYCPDRPGGSRRYNPRGQSDGVSVLTCARARGHAWLARSIAHVLNLARNRDLSARSSVRGARDGIRQGAVVWLRMRLAGFSWVRGPAEPSRFGDVTRGALGLRIRSPWGPWPHGPVGRFDRRRGSPLRGGRCDRRQDKSAGPWSDPSPDMSLWAPGRDARSPSRPPGRRW
jgi:hypothetical protein